jgi:hypothetical protein
MSLLSARYNNLWKLQDGATNTLNYQLCAGNVIKLKKPIFYEYENVTSTFYFKKIEPIKNYRNSQENVLLNYLRNSYNFFFS